jgi:molybdopterin-guanine dinucleotide biosynthesis protein A
VIERMAPQVGALVLSANGDPARFGDFAPPVIADTIPGFQGPLAGLLAGMRWAEARGATSVATAAADTPFFPRDHVERLTRAGAKVAVARSGGRIHPLFCLLPVALAGDLDDFLGRQASRKVTDWLERHGAVAINLDGTGDAPIDPFFNVNTPADLAKAEAVAQSMALRAT